MQQSSYGKETGIRFIRLTLKQSHLYNNLMELPVLPHEHLGPIFMVLLRCLPLIQYIRNHWIAGDIFTVRMWLTPGRASGRKKTLLQKTLHDFVKRKVCHKVWQKSKSAEDKHALDGAKKEVYTAL